MKKKYSLDTTAQIYPFQSNRLFQNSFRFSANIKYNIDPQVLQKALNKTIDLFPVFKVSLKKDFFNYYFSPIGCYPRVFAASDSFLETINSKNCDGYAFRVLYYSQTIAMETYHVITDGLGALEFFKSLLYNYFNIVFPNNIKNELIINNASTDFSNPFDKFYTPLKLNSLKISSLKGNKALILKGKPLKRKTKRITEITLTTSEILNEAKKHNSTISEYIGGILLLSFFETQIKSKLKKGSIQMFVPVNLRKIFNYSTFRNFTLFSRVGVDISYSNSPNIDDFINIVKKSFKRDINKELFLNQISATIKAERLKILKYSPLFLKFLIVKISNLFFGKGKKSFTFSNLGVVKVPSEIQTFISSFSVNLNVSPKIKLAVSTISYADIFKISLTNTTSSKEVEDFIINYFNKNKFSFSSKSTTNGTI